MNNGPLISVVIPNYNGERFIAETIQSVLNQSYQVFEILIIDDCSTDRSRDIINEYVLKNNRISLIINEQNRGVSFTRNIGIQKASGKYIALLDNDDTWEKDKLERQLKIAEQGVDIVYCSYDFIDENNKTIKPPFVVPPQTNFQSMLQQSVISCSTAFINSNLLKQHSFRSDFYHEDYIMWMELLQLPIKNQGDPKVLMHYRQISGSRSNNKLNTAKARWIIYRKALHLDLFTSIKAFIGYSIKGFIKYYMR